MGSQIGDTFQGGLSDIWLGPMEDYCDFGCFSKRSHCELMLWRRDCPVIAHGTNGSLYAPDPQCWKTV